MTTWNACLTIRRGCSIRRVSYSILSLASHQSPLTIPGVYPRYPLTPRSRMLTPFPMPTLPILFFLISAGTAAANALDSLLAE
jgi:hypothetical protein